MKKGTKIAIGALLAVVLIALAVVVVVKLKGDAPTNNDAQKSNLNVQSVEDLQNLVAELYTGLEENLPALETAAVDMEDPDNFTYQTGLSSKDDIEYGVISQPLMNAQAYTLLLLKVKDGVDANKVAKTMSETMDMRKWVCVSAEKLYATNSGNIVFLVMSSEATAKPVYENFKTKAGVVGQEYERTEAI